jgi:hypothetical protein
LALLVPAALLTLTFFILALAFIGSDLAICMLPDCSTGRDGLELANAVAELRAKIQTVVTALNMEGTSTGLNATLNNLRTHSFRSCLTRTAQRLRFRGRCRNAPSEAVAAFYGNFGKLQSLFRDELLEFSFHG